MHDADVPVWLLDIDGVLNANADRPDRRVWPEWVTAEVANLDGFTFPMLASKAVIAFLRRVHEQGAAEIRWHTTWQQGALEVGDAFGLPRFGIQPVPQPTPTASSTAPSTASSLAAPSGPPDTVRTTPAGGVAGEPAANGGIAPDLSTNSSFGAGWWKYPVAEHVVNVEGRRLVWTDDDASFRLGPNERDRLGDALVIAPVTEVGLTSEHLNAIAEFCGLDPSRPVPGSSG